MSIDLTYVCDVVMYDSWRSLSWTSARVGLGLSGMCLYVDSTYHLRGRGADEGSKHRSTRPPVPSRMGYDLRLKDTLSDTISNNHDGMSEMPGS